MDRRRRTGGSLGFTTTDEHFPRQDVRIIAFTNLGDGAPEAGEALTSVVFADLYPNIAAKTLTSVRGAEATITATVRTAFQQPQTGHTYTRFGGKLAAKLAAGAGTKFVTNLGPYGAPSGAVFRGAHQGDGGRWYEYLIQFGPGVWMPFAARLDAAGLIASYSFG